MNPFLWVLTVLGVLVGIIFLLILYLIFGKIRLVADYREGEFKLWLEWLFLKYHVYPDPEKKQAREERKAEKERKKGSSQNASTQEASGTKTVQKKKPKKKSKLRTAARREVRKAVQSVPLKDYAKTLGIIVTKFISKFHCKSFVLYASVGGSQADEIATEYGTINALLYPVLGAFAAANRLHKCDVQITPDFTSEETHAVGTAIFTFRLYQALGCIWELSENLYE